MVLGFVENLVTQGTAAGEGLLHAFRYFGAVNGVPETAGPYIGAVGNFISAVLQTAGLYAQNDVLQFYSTLLDGTAGLIYIVAIFGALISIAIFGDYKKAMLLVMGPVLFHMMLHSTVPGEATKVQIGERVTEGSDTNQRELLDMFSQDQQYQGPLQLSTFFVLYDNLISSIVQGTVAVLIDTQNKQDVITGARERVFGMLFHPSGMNTAYSELVSAGTLGKCADVTKLQIELARLRKPPAPVTPGTPPPPPAPDPNTQAMEQELQTRLKVKDIELSDTERDYLSALDVTVLNTMGVGIPASEWQDLLAQPVYSCEDMWKFVQASSIVEASKYIDLTTNNCTPTTDGNNSNIPWDKVCDDIMQAVSTSDGQLPPKEARKRANQVIAAYMYKATITNTTHSQLMSQVFEHRPITEDANEYSQIFGNVLEADGQGALLALTYFEGAIPYIQGLLLFVLAGGFPFFTVFLVMPGKMQSFAMWMALWLWVKSWDIGFALVTVVRGVLWDYLGRGPTAAGRSFQNVNWDDPTSIIDVIGNVDPLANANTYYVISSVLTLSVPFITAQLCLGASDVYGALKGMFTQPAEGVQRQRTIDLRQQYANEGDKKIEIGQNMARLAGTESAMGFSQSGDASMAMRANVASKGELARYQESPANATDQATRALFTNRLDEWRSGGELLRAELAAGEKTIQQLEAGNPLLGAQSNVLGLGGVQSGLADGDTSLLNFAESGEFRSTASGGTEQALGQDVVPNIGGEGE